MTAPKRISPQIGDSPRVEDSLDDLGDITIRSIFIGLAICVLVSIWCPQSAWIVGASRLNLSQLPVGAFGVFFGVVLLNLLIGRALPRLALTPAEVTVVFVSAFIASVMATSDLLDWVFSVDAVPYYFATPENRWMDDVWPYLQQWAVVRGPSEELRWAFIGMPSAESIPWRIWLLPTFWWATFIGAVGFSSICLAVIFRRQWAEHERLEFPLAQVPLDIMSDPGGKWHIPAVMRTRAFWVGAAIPSSVVFFNMIQYFAPGFPRIPIANEFNIALSEHLGGKLILKLNWYTLGFAYMVSTHILFSVWVWHLIVTVESMVFNSVGYTLGAAGDYYGSRDAITNWQGFGGFIVFVLWGLWMARGHLRDVLRGALGIEPANDERELLPYRWAVPGLLASGAYIGLFLLQLGMTPTMVAVYMFGAFVAYFGTTRVIAQTGLVYMRAPMTPPLFVLGALGTVGIPPSALVGMVGTYSLVGNGRGPLMPAIFHVSWLGAKMGRSGRRMLTVTAIAVVAAYVVGSAYMIYLSYEHGATTFHAAKYTSHGPSIFNAIVKKMQARAVVDPGKVMFLGIGATVMSLLTVLQYRFPGWPLHPIGFPIAANFHVDFGLLPVFLAWFIKSLVLRIGGVETYARSRRVFIGMIAGYALAVAVSFLVDWIWFPRAGHQVHSW